MFVFLTKTNIVIGFRGAYIMNDGHFDISTMAIGSGVKAGLLGSVLQLSSLSDAHPHVKLRCLPSRVA